MQSVPFNVTRQFKTTIRHTLDLFSNESEITAAEIIVVTKNVFVGPTTAGTF